VIVGLVIVAVVAAGQLGKKATGKLSDPGIAYPAALLHGNSIGDPNAPVTLEVYGDFQCPRCAEHSLQVEPIIVAKYVKDGKVRIVHHDIAILSATADKESERAARGAYCADQQGKYWDYAHWVFNNQDGENAGGFAHDRLVAIAATAGLDQAAFEACLDSPEAVQAVADTTAKATALGINSTPTLALNGTLLTPGVHTPDDLGARIEKVLASPAPGASGGASPIASPAASAAASPSLAP
jgi:protein-disulfide isomerase